jgi:hypothetical protein
MEKEFTPRPGRLMDQVRETLRFFHYAPSTEKSYIHWILRYVRFKDRHHPGEIDKRRRAISESPCSLAQETTRTLCPSTTVSYPCKELNIGQN